MSDCEDRLYDALRDQEYEQILEQEHLEQLIEEFREERLSSYYLANPDLALPAINFLKKSKTIQKTDSTSSFILAFAASEYFLKKVMLEPLVAGLIHDETLDIVIANIVMKDKGFKKLLFKIMQENNIDLDKWVLEETDRSINAEWERQKDIRNYAVHKCVEVNKQDSVLAISLAEFLMTDIFTHFVSIFGITTNLNIPTSLE
jgi:hypothetical protein